jgi:hypothetical protein
VVGLAAMFMTLSGSTPRQAEAAAYGERPLAATDAAAARAGGNELYGYLPYWEMNSTMADYVAGLPLTDLELFSVSAGKNGGLHKSEIGYRRITGAIGTRLISEAHARGQRVQLVFTSFTFEKNTPFFGRASLESIDDRRGVQTLATPARSATLPWRRTARELVALAVQLGVDGIDVDVEQIRGDSYEGYTAFLGDLRARLDAAIPGAKLTVATTANQISLARRSPAASIGCSSWATSTTGPARIRARARRSSGSTTATSA